MWIQNTQPDVYPTESLRSEATNGELVEFTENWKANVSRDVGERLVEQYDHLEPTEAVESSKSTEED